jgi:fructose-1-phosphate kinase PfkB-like protein
MDQNEKGLLSVEMPYALESVTGAGDAASAAIVDGLARNLPIEKIAAQAMRASKLTLQTQERVHPDIGTIRLV